VFKWVHWGCKGVKKDLFPCDLESSQKGLGGGLQETGLVRRATRGWTRRKSAQERGGVVPDLQPILRPQSTPKKGKDSFQGSRQGGKPGGRGFWGKKDGGVQAQGRGVGY